MALKDHTSTKSWYMPEKQIPGSIFSAQTILHPQGSELSSQPFHVIRMCIKSYGMQNNSGTLGTKAGNQLQPPKAEHDLP